MTWHTSPIVPGNFRSSVPVGTRIAELRLARGWDRRELARKAGVKQTTVYNHETGKVRAKPATLAAYAHVFDLSFKQFISLTDVWREYEYHSVVTSKTHGKARWQ